MYRQNSAFVILDFHRPQQQVRHCVEVKAAAPFLRYVFSPKIGCHHRLHKFIVTAGENPLSGIPIVSIPQYFVFVNRKILIIMGKFAGNFFKKLSRGFAAF